MLERMRDLPAAIDGVRATGELTVDDYERIVRPLLEEARRDGRRLRFFYELAPDFTGLTPAAAWEDLRLGLRFLRLFDGVAVASDAVWVRDAARLVGVFMPCPVRAFPISAHADALAWLVALTAGGGVSHRVLLDSGVIVVEVTSALCAEDFDSLSATADALIAANGELRGLVIHTHKFPGWENVAGFFRHLRFVRDHHQKIRRVALAADGRLANVAPELASHFVRAEIKHFEFNALDQAIAWASGESTRVAATRATTT
jgi:hypothetical protein